LHYCASTNIANQCLAHFRTQEFNSASPQEIIHHHKKVQHLLPFTFLRALLRQSRETIISLQDPSKWPPNQPRTLRTHLIKRNTDGMAARSSARARGRCHTTVRRHRSTTQPSMRRSQRRYVSIHINFASLVWTGGICCHVLKMCFGQYLICTLLQIGKPSKA
jgi:hypothetical protein